MGTSANLCKVHTGYFVYRNMFVLVKWNIKIWDACFLSHSYFLTIHCYEYVLKPKLALLPKAEKSPPTLLNYA